MIEIVQAGQTGKTKLLFDMHRMRAHIFKDRMGWDVDINDMGMEVDQFDIQEAVYFLALDSENNVIGSWRILPTTGPTMIDQVWPDFLTTLPIPKSPQAWEASRFGIHSMKGKTREGLVQVNRATAELFCALTETCLLCGIEEIYTLYDERIERLIKRLDCIPEKISDKKDIDGIPCQIGRFKTDTSMLHRLRQACGIQENLIEAQNLPPILENLKKVSDRKPAGNGESFYA